MTFEYLVDPANGPRWKGLLPGTADAFFLRRGDGEHAKLFGDLFTVLLSGDETEGQFGIITSQSPAGDIIPTHAHADTHETFYVLDGQVRVFVQDRAGQKASRLLAQLPRSPAVPVAARRGRSPRPVRAERTAAQRTVQDGPER
jgi:hypothetical protein